MLKFLICMIALFSFSTCVANIDLEETFSKPFVLESKKITIPNYPDAFNAAIIRWDNSILMSFRTIPNVKYTFESDIGLVWLDENFNVTSKPQILKMRDANAKAPCRAEDARLIAVNNRLYLIYSDNEDKLISRGGFRVYIAELSMSPDKKFVIKRSECIRNFEDNSKDRREKNWVPFDFNGNLLLAYSLLPHKILYYCPGSESCKTLVTTFSSTDWKWGILRGGTPALLEGKDYLAFFHSSMMMESVHSKGKEITHYFMGAYTFSATPPFEIKSMSIEPIIGKNFYKGIEYKPYWKPVKAVFPCGFISDKRYVWIAYGRDDHEIWITKLDKKGLLKSLEPVSSCFCPF